MEMEVENQESTSGRLRYCEVCESNVAVYTCPRCELKTCSLNCIKIHKKEFECNGDRDKTSFVPISQFNNLTLLSDYRLLEDASRAIDNCRRNPLKKYTRFKKQLPPHLYRLKKQALRQKTILQYLPQHFTRHKQNTTFLNFENRIIYWRIDLIFPQGDNIKTVLEKCDENERLSSIVSKFIDYNNCPDLYKKNLRFYHSMGLSGIEVLLKAECVQTQPSFFILDKSSTLKENFENRIIVEYPILYVIFKSHKDEYTILDSEMEVNSDMNNKGGKNFIDFTPFSYFDTISYTKKQTEGDKAVKSISASVAALKKYFSANESADEEEDEQEQQKVMEVQNTEPNTQSFSYRKELNIPTYENLIKQSL